VPRGLRVVRGHGSIAPPRWMGAALYAAAADNLLWGAFIVLQPQALFRWTATPVPNYPGLWQCVGLMVGALGVGYWAAAREPLTHWPLVLVGLLTDVLGGLGLVGASVRGELPWEFSLPLAVSALVWGPPFAVILIRAHQRRAASLRTTDDRRTLRRA